MLKRLIHSAGAVTIGQGLNILGNLALVPLFLAHWPNAVYGEWIALSATVAYLGTLDLGMNAAAGNSLVAAYAKGDGLRYRSLQSSAMVFYLALAVATSLLAGVACLALPLPRWLGVTHIEQHIGALIVWSLAARLMWQMPAAQIWNVFRTTGDQATTQWMWNLQFGGGILVTGCVVMLGGNPGAVALWLFVPSALATAVAWVLIKRRYPDLLPVLKAASQAEMRNLLRPSLFFALITIGSALALNGPVIAVSRMAGGIAVALLVTTRTLATVVRQAQAVITTAIWPHLTSMDATGETGAFRTAHRLLIALSMICSVALASAIWFEGPEIMAIWTRGRLNCDVLLLRVFLVAAVPQALWSASSMFPIATNRHHALAKAYMWSAIITTVTTATLVSHLGPLAAAIGVLVGEATACYHFVIKDSCTVVAEPYLPFAGRMWGSLLLVSLLTGSAAWAAHRFGWGPPPLRWTETGFTALLVSSMAVWVSFLGPARRTILARIRLKFPLRLEAEVTC